MSGTDMRAGRGAHEIGLEGVAADARGLIRAFRKAGSVSFQDVPIKTARANYEAACRRNGLQRREVAVVRYHSIAVDGASTTVAVREYRPAAEGSLPAVLFIHGGGWVIGNLETHDTLCRQLAHASRFAVFAIDYRLAPEHKFPVPLLDCSRALHWLAASASVLDIDLQSIFVVGDSAGGNMAAVLANDADLRPEGLDLAGHALLYPVTDLAAEAASYTHITSGFPLTADSMRWFRAQYLKQGDNAEHPWISPLRASEKSQAALFLVTCGLDPLADEGIAYGSALARAGNRVEHHHLPSHAHGLFTSAGRIRTGRKLVARMAAFLREAARPASS